MIMEKIVLFIINVIKIKCTNKISFSECPVHIIALMHDPNMRVRKMSNYCLDIIKVNILFFNLGFVLKNNAITTAYIF